MTVMTLADETFFEFLKKTGEYPNTLYLDSANFDLFLKEAEVELTWFGRSERVKITNHKFPNPWYKGMHIFKVMTDTYHVHAVKL